MGRFALLRPGNRAHPRTRRDVQCAEVCIPSEEKPYERWPSLKGVRSMRWRGNVKEVTEFIGENTDLDLSSVVAPGPHETESKSPKRRLPFGVSLRTGDYRESAPMLSHFIQKGRFPERRVTFKERLNPGMPVSHHV